MTREEYLALDDHAKMMARLKALDDIARASTMAVLSSSEDEVQMQMPVVQGSALRGRLREAALSGTVKAWDANGTVTVRVKDGLLKSVLKQKGGRGFYLPRVGDEVLIEERVGKSKPTGQKKIS